MSEDLLGAPVKERPGMGGHQSASAKNEEHLTPPSILQALGQFSLDPCAPIVRPWATAERHFTKLDNGLVQPWEGRVWMNCPYGPETDRWLARLAGHGDGVALIFARTETETWFRHIWPVAHAVLFLKGRLTFYTVQGKPMAYNGGAPSALIAYGADNAAALRRSGLAGALVELNRPVVINGG